MTEAPGDDVLEVLRRWTGAGGTWRAAGVSGDGVDLELLTCSGGEVMGRLHAPDASVLEQLDVRADPAGS